MEGPKDDLKWFGEGFDGFPKHLPEDCVEYTLFIIDLKLTQREILNRLEAVRREASKLTDSLLKDYIWQRDEFSLKLEVDNQKGLKYLHGLTNYGDSVEDEWLIVYLLKELSSKFPDLWIKVVDTDGEFMLIEAANALPRWLNPEIADNRIWINSNKLRIIPLTAASTETSKKTAPVSQSLAQEEAHAIISRNPDLLIHSPLVEAEAFYRLRNYPDQIKASLHHACITIPRKLAYLIHNCPASIAPAVEAFYLRDPIALKPLLSTSSTLILPPSDLITTSVRFTKVLYAQLKSQQFSPPELWKPILTAAETGTATDKSRQINHARLEMGMKVTSGYEMLLTDSKHKDNRRVREMHILLEDLQEPETALPTDEEIKNWKDADREDSESWLDINFEDFERELAGKKQSGNDATKSKGPEGAFGPEKKGGFGDKKTEDDLKKIVQRFEAFMNDEDAGIDGADVDEMDIDDDDEDDEDSEEDSEEEDKEISFNEQEFARMMREMMGMPPLPTTTTDTTTTSNPIPKTNTTNRNHKITELHSSDDESDATSTISDEGEEIRKVMARIEAELNEAGALDLDPTPKKLAALKGKGKGKSTTTDTGNSDNSRDKGKGKQIIHNEDEEEEEESDNEEINIDFNLAKNLLESFKSQSGMPGPGGNLLGLMGLQLPRDEDDVEADIKAGQMGKRMD